MIFHFCLMYLTFFYEKTDWFTRFANSIFISTWNKLLFNSGYFWTSPSCPTFTTPREERWETWSRQNYPGSLIAPHATSSPTSGEIILYRRQLEVSVVYCHATLRRRGGINVIFNFLSKNKYINRYQSNLYLTFLC